MLTCPINFQDPISDKLDRVLNLMEQINDDEQYCPSPNRTKYAKFASDWANCDVNTAGGSIEIQNPKATAEGNSKHLKNTSSMFKLNIKKASNDVAINFNKCLHDARSSLPSLAMNKKNTDSVEVCFENYDAACKAKEVLDE